MSAHEEWRPCFYGLYSVSSMGRVRREVSAANGARVGRILKGHVGKIGYPVVQLKDGTRLKTATVHRLVAEAFIGACPKGWEVNHINGVKTDPRVENLEYVTSSGNRRHAYDSGLTPSGMRHHWATLSDDDVREIRTLRATTRMSPREIAERFGVSPQTVSRIASRSTWRHVA